MPSRRRHTIPNIVWNSYGLALAAPEVIAHRLMRLWLAGPNPSQRDREEFFRMSAEKVVAFHESCNSMFVEMLRGNLQLALSSIWWPWSSWASGRAPNRLSAHNRRLMSAMFSAGLAPIHRRAVANAKRLRRVRL